MAGRVCGLPSWSIGARAVHTRRPGPHFMVDTASTILGSKDRVSMLVGVGWGGGRRDGRQGLWAAIMEHRGQSCAHQAAWPSFHG